MQDNNLNPIAPIAPEETQTPIVPPAIAAPNPNQPVSAPENLAPATAENQEATSEAVQDQKTSEHKKQKAIARIQSKSPNAFGIEPDQDAIYAEMQMIDAEEQEQISLDLQDKQIQDQQLLANKEDYLKKKNYFLSKGLEFTPNPEMENLLEKDIKQGEIEAIANEAAQNEFATKVEQASTPEEQDIILKQAPLKEAKATEIAIQRQQQEEQHYQNYIDEARKEFEAQDKEVVAKFVDPDPDAFWNNKSTGQKLLMALSVGLGGYVSGVTGQKNTAMDMLNKAIDNSINAINDKNKLTQAQRETLRQNYIGKVNEKLDIMKERRADANFQLQAENIKNSLNIQYQELDLKKQKAYNDQAQLLASQQNADTIAQLKSSETGFTTAQAHLLPEEDKKNLIKFKDGKFRYAFGGAGDVTKLKESVASSNRAISTLKRLEEVANSPNKSVDLDLRKEAEVLQTMLKGDLRLKILGPGVMTDYESKLMDKIIANPTAIFSLDSRNKTSLQTLMRKVAVGTKQELRTSGIALPMSEAEKKYETFKAKTLQSKLPDEQKAKTISTYLLNNPIPVEEF